MGLGHVCTEQVNLDVVFNLVDPNVFEGVRVRNFQGLGGGLPGHLLVPWGRLLG